MKYLFTILILVCSLFLFAQKPVDDVDYQYSRSYLEQLIREEINAYRTSKSLPPYIKDEVLTLAAEDQSLFILKSGSVTHSQPSGKKDTPFNRAMFYDGMHGKVSENCYKVKIDTYMKSPKSGGKVKIKSYESVAKIIVEGWLADKDDKEVISNPKYVNSGLAVLLDEKDKTVIATHVVASEPYLLPPGVKPNRDDYGIESYDKNKCGELISTYPYLPQLMSDNIYFKNGQIYFYFHDLALFQNVLKDSKDAIALDIISRDQFACGSGNKLYPSKIHTGIMLPPIPKSHIFGKNELKEKGEIEVALGPIPDYVDTNKTEFNLLIIKDNCLCQTIVYNSLGGENLHSLDMRLIMDTLSVTDRADSILNVLKFTIPFEKNKTNYSDADIKPFLDSISLPKYELKNIAILAYSSIEGEVKTNEILQQKRAKTILKAMQKYNLKDVPYTIKTAENWEGFFESIKGSPYEKDFKGKSKEEIRKIVNSDTLSYDLEPYLETQREAIITLTVEKVFMDESLYQMLPKYFENALSNKDFAKAKIYQSVMINSIKNGKMNKEVVLTPQLPHLKEAVPLNNNQIAFRWKNQIESADEDSLNKHLLKEIETQLVIAPDNVFLKYNKIALRLLLWATKYSREPNPKDLLREIKALYSTEIEKWQISRLVLNYNLVAADVYYDNNKFKERDKALDEVQKILLQSNLTRDQVFKVANYFIFQMRIDWTIELMKPWAEKPNIDEEFLYTFLSVAIYNKEKVPEEEYLQFMERAKLMNKKRFCNLFGFPNMSFQLLKDLSVKELYCNTCH
ncbi:MAG: CAP domain-containing protein [Vicingus serpentipes]|nr:CAP domain-containing protein [Vicingus serpentipes]